jgi:hypothetical protein
MATEPFRTLRASVKTDIAAFQLKLKQSMAAALDLEIALAKSDVETTFFKTVEDLGSILYLSEFPNSTITPTKSLTCFILQKQPHVLFSHLPINSATSIAKYKEFVHGNSNAHADEDPTAEEFPKALETTGEIPFHFAQTEQFAKVQMKIDAILLNIFKKSWDEQLAIYQQQQVTLRLNARVHAITTGVATEETAMEIDTQPAADPKTINSLISTAVNKQTKKLSAEVDQLRQQLQRSKSKPKAHPKVNRGASSSRRAPATKKSQTKPKTTNNRPKSGSVDDADNDSSASNKSKRRQSTKKKPNTSKSGKNRASRK